ncbi:MAG: TetR/AcrR family transcriptional regulator [Neisseria sp.]|uniref:TetR/AcrR family transcriptional regulator n=1 Tax=Neisseria sp. TaxID=192066 RepID=UPI0026DA8535|nr:TetR/AcrR family transcriptional regulator [Neisseria sp.]MDO4247450.1 TetR/AcrR family transcriptional regulator [Neisseria sp.]
MAKEPRQNTYTKIIEASLLLFNEEGERQISTNHIAAYLGISPGNLYYHFRNKDEIIIQLYKRYSEELLALLTDRPLPLSIVELVEYLAGVYNIMWRYRFLFSDVNSLLSRSNELLGEYHDFTQTRIAPLMVRQLISFAEMGIIQGTEEEMRSLAMNMWIITKYWFDFDSSMRGRMGLSEDSKLRGIERTLSLLRPFLNLEYLAEFDQVMAELAEPVEG